MIETTMEIPQHLIYFYNLIKSYESTFGKNAKSLDMNTNEILILLEIYNKEGLNQIDIAKRYLITEANISQTTKKLMKKGFIEKKMDPENNSKNLLFLTEKGKNYLRNCLSCLEIGTIRSLKEFPLKT